jgi:SAM-dependent methyltransferase
MEMCSICGGSDFVANKVLWPELIAEWELAEHEEAYIDEQQGYTCRNCEANARIIALGNAVRGALGTDFTIQAFVSTPAAQKLRILDLNGGVSISPALAGLPNYIRANFPKVDMQSLPYENGAFDLVIHSDTLEHIENPARALQECRRVLAKDGRLCFTVPVVVGRMTRNRTGLAPSYHGNSSDDKLDYIVHTEFGADAWTYVMQAGFSHFTVNQFRYPASVAFTAWCDSSPVINESGPISTAPELPKLPGNFISRLNRIFNLNEIGTKKDESFDEDDYLEANTDIAAAVDKGEIVSGWKHYKAFGKKEGRRLKIEDSPIPLMAPPVDTYDQDGLSSIHNHEFMTDSRFQQAYERGIQAAGEDYRWHWRVHVGLWAAACAAKLPGDFVECGVNRGFLSSAIMFLLDWDQTGRIFYLLDTFKGIDERFLSDADREQGVIARNARDVASGFYTFDVNSVRKNFAEWKNIKIVAGSIPETLSEISSRQIAFLHIDLNCSLPEVAAADALWDRLSPGGFVLLDDYAYHGFRSKKLGMDEFAKRRGVEILSLPTGQGLMIKPALR